FRRSSATAKSCSHIFAPSIHIPKHTSWATISCGPCRKLPVPIAVAGDFTPSSHISRASYALPRLDPRARKYVVLRGANHAEFSICACHPGIARPAAANVRESESAVAQPILAVRPVKSTDPVTDPAKTPAARARVVYVFTEMA